MTNGNHSGSGSGSGGGGSTQNNINQGSGQKKSAQIAARKGTTKKKIVWNFRQTKDDARQDGNQFSKE